VTPPGLPLRGYGETLTAFRLAHTTAREQFTSYLAEELQEIKLVECTDSGDDDEAAKDGPALECAVRVGDIV
jgi:hypothetical protein